ncbi:MAG: hypothetical protein AAF573_09095, partial [Bacteroidota bacterium]
SEQSKAATGTKNKASYLGKVKLANKKVPVGKSKSQSTVNGVCDDEDLDSEDTQSVNSNADRRPTPKTNYDETSAHCPLPGCDSKGKFFAKVVANQQIYNSSMN